MNEKSANAAEDFLRTIINTEKCSLTRLNSPNATEMAKVLENSYRAMNIAFMVEWSRFAEEAEVDLYAVVNAIRERPTHANLMFPGIGVGGYCLTKDPLLASWSRQNLFDGDAPLIQSEQSVKTNDKMPAFAFDFLKHHYDGNIKDAKVLLLGVSYRGEVGDTRSTPVDLLYDCLAQARANIFLHDPYVPYWEEKELTVEQSIETALDNDVDIIIISTGHQLYKNHEVLKKIEKKKGIFIYDTIGLYSAEEIVQLRQNNIVKVLGRGDL
jgi:nucleotide sugar dehydrogenase